MTDLCPSCKEPLDYPSGDGCAAMTKHQPVKETTKIDWQAALDALDASLPERLERVALMAEIANHYIDDMRVMPAAGVADILYEALFEIRHHRGIEE
jgi:hypothetical protein